MTSLYSTLATLEQTGAAAALCTIVRARGSVPRHVGSKMLVYPDGRLEGTVGGGALENRIAAEALAVLQTGTPRLVQHQLVDPASGDPGVCGGEIEVFIEPVQPRPTLLVVGGGHVGRALVHLGAWLGFRVVLAEDRPEFCTPEAAPGADDYLLGPLRDLPARLNLTPNTYIVLPTRGVPVDVEALPVLLAHPHAYLGVIGSRRRWLTARAQLLAAGVAAAALAQVHAPMGLELNAETPEEIALSVLAEIILLRRGGTGRAMRAEPETSKQ